MQLISGPPPAVGYRINDECACDGPVDLLVEEFHYSEAGGRNPIANPNLANGLEAWIPWGEVMQQVEPAGLHVLAESGQVASLNSEMFPVTAGEQFTMTFWARVSPQSDGNGYFTLIFHGDDGAIRRFRAHLRPSRATVGEVVTGAEGQFELLVDQPAAPKLFEAWYSGSQIYWPALAGELE